MSDSSNGAPTPDAAEHFAIGISFGNSNSSIARTSVEGKAEVIANEEGDRQIPSVLSYIDGEEFHGTQAKTQLVRNHQNTVQNFRDYLGKDFKSIDPTPSHNSAHPQEHEAGVAFSIRDAEAEEPNTRSVSEIVTRHLRRLASSASDYLGKTVNSAVISIPTDFTDVQKDELTKAAKAAGIEVLQFIPEPIAAVLAYDAKSDMQVKDKLIVVADLGGNRSDVAVVASRGGMYTILATHHDPELGGVQLDQVLVDHFAKEFIKKNKTDPRSNQKSLAKLKLESEAVKKSLSQSASATASIESLADGVDFNSTINRTRYELLASKVFGKFAELIQESVKKAELDVLDIDEIILSGGTSHTPKIASNLKYIFPSSDIQAPSASTTAINPSELAARGAAIQASLIEEFEKDDIDQSTHAALTVTPHLSKAIGVELTRSTEGSVFEPLIYADTAAPARRTVQLKAPGEGSVLVKVCEGESEIKVTKPEPKEKPEANGDKGSDDEDDSDFDDEEEEEDDIRERIWKVGKSLAEISIEGIKKNDKVEVTVNVNPDLSVQVTARVVGSKGGVRGNLDAPKTETNGSA